MSTLADEPPRKTNQRRSSPSLFSSLPLDIVLNILARVPKRYYPVLCCVSKNFRSLVRSPEINKTRYLLGKDSLYICFIDETKCPVTCHWFNLRRIENNTTDENVVVPIDFPLLPKPCRYSSSVVAVSPEIFFIPGYNIPSSTFYIFDTRTGKIRQGPRNMLVKRLYNSVGLVGDKLYVVGGYRDDEIQAEVFDLKAQTWEEVLKSDSNME